VNETLDRLTKLAAQRSARLESLREACWPIARLIAPLRQPHGDQAIPYLITLESKPWPCLVVNQQGKDEFGPGRVDTWSLDYPCGQPSGPTPRQLRDFAAWLCNPETLQAIADLEQKTAEDVDNWTLRLNAAAAAMLPYLKK